MLWHSLTTCAVVFKVNANGSEAAQSEAAASQAAVPAAEPEATAVAALLLSAKIGGGGGFFPPLSPPPPPPLTLLPPPPVVAFLFWVGFGGVRVRGRGEEGGRGGGGYHGLFLEIKKDKKSYPTKEQKEWIAYLNDVGYCARVTKGVDESIQTIDDYLNNKL